MALAGDTGSVRDSKTISNSPLPHMWLRTLVSESLHFPQAEGPRFEGQTLPPKAGWVLPPTIAHSLYCLHLLSALRVATQPLPEGSL